MEFPGTLKHKLVWYLYRIKSFIRKNASVRISHSVKMMLNTDNEHEAHRVATFFTKEPDMLRWINEFDDDKSTVFFDIGANVGIYSIYAALTKNNITVYSFEPEVFSFKSLLINIYNNNLQNCKPILTSLSSEQKICQFFTGVLKPGAGAGSVGKPYHNIPLKDHVDYGLYATTLDAIIDSRAVEFPKYIKIDVDGHEQEIIDGATKTLKDERLLAIMLEIEETPESERIFEKLSESGFVLSSSSEWFVKSDAGHKIRNYLFKRNNQLC
jgi:FkbM family methyltransferase